jgi:hypothetical protein
MDSRSYAAIWQGFTCADCGRSFRWSHRCKVTGARFTTYGRTSENGEPFGLNASASKPFRMPSSMYVEP